jgi:hypothetical protein
MEKISALTGVNFFLFDTYSIALSELAETPFELNSLNLLHKFFASLGFFFTLSNKFDWLKAGNKELKNKNNKNKEGFIMVHFSKFYNKKIF